jgi:hypothetical protein
MFAVFMVLLVVAAVGFAARTMKLVKETFDDLLPDRMVDFTGFIDIPKA